MPTLVNVTFNLVAIQEFDEVNGTFSVIGFFEVSWYDSRMTWNPSEYNNTYKLFTSDNVEPVTMAATWIKNQANSHIVTLFTYYNYGNLK
jgi:hypothetical protein